MNKKKKKEINLLCEINDTGISCIDVFRKTV